MVTCRVGFKAGPLSVEHFALVTGIAEDGTVHVQDSWGFGGLRTGIDADGGMFTLSWQKFDACWRSVPTEAEIQEGSLSGVDAQCRSWVQILPRDPSVSTHRSPLAQISICTDLTAYSHHCSCLFSGPDPDALRSSRRSQNRRTNRRCVRYADCFVQMLFCTLSI